MKTLTERRREGRGWIVGRTQVDEPPELDMDFPAEPEPRPEPEPEPVPYQVAFAAPPAEVDPDALALLSQARGLAAVDELVQAVSVLDDHLRHRIDGLTGPSDLIAAVSSMNVLRARRDAYSARLRAVAELLEIGPPDVGPALDVPRSSLLELDAARGQMVRDRLDALRGGLADAAAIAGNDVAYACQGRPARMTRAALDAELAAMERRERELIGEMKGTRLLPLPPHAWAQDAWLARTSDLIRQQRAARAELDQVEADRERALELTAAGVGAAVHRAGGVEAVVKAATAAITLGAPIIAEPAELATIDADLARLAAAGIDSTPSVDALVRRRMEILAASTVTMATTKHSRQEQAESIVRGALDGSEHQRSALASLATAHTIAFPAGFAPAIAEARADRMEFAAVMAAVR